VGRNRQHCRQFGYGLYVKARLVGEFFAVDYRMILGNIKGQV